MNLYTVFIQLGAGLGLNGILAWRMTTGSTVCITDGDSDALVHLRQNIERNEPSSSFEDASKVSCRQLIWGKEASTKFQDNFNQGQMYDVILASDIIYAKCIIEPLMETIQTLLSRDGVFIMAFAKRRVPISIEFVLEFAENSGLVYELASEDKEEGIWVYLFRFKIGDDTK